MPRAIPRAEQLIAKMKEITDQVRDGSNLACAIMGGALVEKAFGSMLHRLFGGGGNSEALLQDVGPLGTAASKAKVAYCLGLVPVQMFQNAEKIGLIRNEFAHSHVEIDFSQKTVADACEGLAFPSLMFDDGSHIGTFESEKATNREKFVYAVGNAALYATLVSQHIKPCKPIKTPWDYLAHNTVVKRHQPERRTEATDG